MGSELGHGDAPVAETAVDRGSPGDDGCLADDVATALGRAQGLLATTRSPGVAGQDRWSAAGRKNLRFHLARMLVRVPGVVVGEDPEEVHAMRVASRRMRAAWRIFGDAFEEEVADRCRADLRVVGERLGSVRDLDVLLEILDGYGGRRTARIRRGLLPLRVAWVSERTRLHTAFVAHLGSASFGTFVAEHEDLVAGDGASATTRAPGNGVDERVRVRMPVTAWRAYGRVLAYEDLLEDRDLRTLHRLRIEGKWLRYTLESVREALGSEGALIIEPVIGLQDHLGVQHDLHVAATLAASFMTDDASSLTTKERSVIERFVADLDARVAWHGDRLGRAWDPVASPAYRARLGRALGRL
jgi:CHAD domain-containing protein